MNKKIKELVLVAMFTALIAVGAFIKFPMLGVPMTMQSFFVILAALVLRKEMAFLSVLLYIVMGLIGLPVFTSGGGPQYVLFPSFGYLLGFLVSVYFISTLKEKLNVYFVIVVGILLVYVVGVPYFTFIQSVINGKSYPISFLVTNLFLVFLPKDIIFGVLAYKISQITKKSINI